MPLIMLYLLYNSLYHPGQSSSTPSPPFSQGYWPLPPWAPLAVDDTDAAATTTFFFTINGKSIVPTFNYSIRNTNKCGTSHLLIHLYLQGSFIGQTRLHGWGSKHGRIRWERGRWHQQRRSAMNELYVLLRPCVKSMQIFVWRLYIVVWRLRIFIDLCLVVSKLYVLLYKSVIWLVLEAPHLGRQPK
jgi:hypothetical protein